MRIREKSLILIFFNPTVAYISFRRVVDELHCLCLQSHLSISVYPQVFPLTPTRVNIGNTYSDIRVHTCKDGESWTDITQDSGAQATLRGFSRLVGTYLEATIDRKVGRASAPDDALFKGKSGQEK